MDEEPSTRGKTRMCTHRHYLELHWDYLQRRGLQAAMGRTVKGVEPEDVVAEAMISFLKAEHCCRGRCGYCHRHCSRCTHPHCCIACERDSNCYEEHRCCTILFLHIVRNKCIDMNRRAQRSLKTTSLGDAFDAEKRPFRRNSRYDIGSTIIGRIGELLTAVPRPRNNDGGLFQRLMPNVSDDEWKEVRSKALKVALRILGNEIDADRAVGRATEKVTKSKTVPKRLGPYFVRVVRGEANRIYSRRRGRVTVNGGEWDWSDEGEGIAAFEQVEDLKFAMQGLSEKDCSILDMKYRDSMTFAEIGAALDMTEAAARQQHGRLIRKLRAKLEPEESVKSATTGRAGGMRKAP